jgi:hypothetical protein
MKKRTLSAAIVMGLVAALFSAPTITQAAPAAIDTGAWYMVVSKASGMYVDVAGGGTGNGTSVQQYVANYTNSQMFKFTANGDGTYRVTSKLSTTQVWDVKDGLTVSGTKIQTWAWAGNPQQRWQVKSASTSGYVTLRPAHATSRCLTVPGGTKAVTQLQIATCSSTATSQQFRMVKVTKVAGACKAFVGATTLGTYMIGSYALPVCGPRPSTQLADGSFVDNKWAGYTVRPYTNAPTSHPGYQCAELAARWLYHRYGVASTSANGAAVVKNYVAKHPTKFAKYANGAVGNAPKVGDVVSFSNSSTRSDFGHVGVVMSSSVNSSGNGTVKLAEQNYHGTGGTAGVHSYTVTAWKITGSGFRYVEWLHAK